LLKKKSDALKRAFNEIMKAIVLTKKNMGREFQEAQLEMAQAKFAAGEFGVTVRDSVKQKTNVYLTVSIENVAGVMKPTFNLQGTKDGDDGTNILGLTGGGQAIMKAQEKYKKYLELLVAIASLQAQFSVMERELKLTNRRVNALEFVVIPRIEKTIKWI
jgi:V-type H+-transporting ATPase subunit D